LHWAISSPCGWAYSTSLWIGVSLRAWSTGGVEALGAAASGVRVEGTGVAAAGAFRSGAGSLGCGDVGVGVGLGAGVRVPVCPVAVLPEVPAEAAPVRVGVDDGVIGLADGLVRVPSKPGADAGVRLGVVPERLAEDEDGFQPIRSGVLCAAPVPPSHVCIANTEGATR
jgi:hypothetical protein